MPNCSSWISSGKWFVEFFGIIFRLILFDGSNECIEIILLFICLFVRLIRNTCSCKGNCCVGRREVHDKFTQLAIWQCMARDAEPCNEQGTLLREWIHSKFYSLLWIIWLKNVWKMSYYYKVAEAEKKKAEAHAEHQRKALICNKAELEVSSTIISISNFSHPLRCRITVNRKYDCFGCLCIVSIQYRSFSSYSNFLPNKFGFYAAPNCLTLEQREFPI